MNTEKAEQFLIEKCEGDPSKWKGARNLTPAEWYVLMEEYKAQGMPTEEEYANKRNELIEASYNDDNNIGMRYGFAMCYNWFKERLTK